MIKGSIQEEDITVVNICEPSTGAPKYIRQILRDIKGEIDGNTLMVGDFNTKLTSMDISSRQKITKAIENQFDIIEQLDLISSGDYIQQKNKTNKQTKNPEYTFFLSAQKHSLGQTIYQDTKQASTNLRGQKLFQVSFLTTTA